MCTHLIILEETSGRGRPTRSAFGGVKRPRLATLTRARGRRSGSHARCMEHVPGAREIAKGGIGRNAFAGGMLVLAGIASSRHRLFSRTQQPKGSSTGARNWPWSGQEIRWRQCRGCA
jgi:hypothetical protein